MEKGQKTLTPRLYHNLSPNSICKKSPNLLAALLPPPDSGLKQCRRGVQPWAGTGGSWQGAIRPKKECIKSCETCFAKNVLSLNVKGPSTK